MRKLIMKESFRGCLKNIVPFLLYGLLGMPPSWFKMAAYRSRAVREPRSVLAEFGVELDEGVDVKVWDSTAELRFIVLPQRPAGADGWDEARLAELVTRNAMIGTHRDLTVNS